MKIVIVGATSGIGLEVAVLFIKAGWHVGVAGRRAELLAKLKNEYGDVVHTKVLDITQPQQACESLSELIDEMGGIDVYFHCAGVGHQNADLLDDIEMDTVYTNVVGFTAMIGVAFRYFKHNGGHIAIVSSIAGTKGLGSAPAYSATKRFQNSYIQCLAQLSHMEKLNISFTDIRPGFVNTSLLSDKRKYPMVMNAKYCASKIYAAIVHRRRVCVVDWKYKILVFFWRLIPNFIWERISVKN